MADIAQYDDLFEQAGRAHNVDPALLRVIAVQESGGDAGAVGPQTASGRAQGLMQLVPATAAALGVKDPHDPAQAIDGAARLLASHLDQFGNVPDAVAAYYGGPDQSSWGPKTLAYRQQVSSAYSGDISDDLIFGGSAPKTGTAGPELTDDLIFGSSKSAAPKTNASRIPAKNAALLRSMGRDPEATGIASQEVLEQTAPATQTGAGGAKKPGRAADAALATGSGVERGLLTMALTAGPFVRAMNDPVGTAIDVGGKLSRGEAPAIGGDMRAAGDFVSRQFLPADQREAVKQQQMVRRIADLQPTTQEMVGAAPGANYHGQTGFSRFLGTLGEFAPNAIFPETAAGRISSLVLPAAASSAGGAIGKKVGGETGEAIGNLTGALVGGSGATALERAPNRLMQGAAPLEEQIAAHTAAQGLPVPVPLTQGQINRAPAQQMLENAALRGGSGDAAARIMQDAATERQTALRGNVEAIQTQMGGATERGAGGAAVSERLNTLFDDAKAGVDDAFHAARETGRGVALAPAERPVIGQRLAESVKDYDAEQIAPVKRALAHLEGSPTGEPLAVRDLFDTRAKLSVLRGGADPIIGRAAGAATRELDSYIDDALAADMLKGDETAVNAWRDAIGKRRDFGKMFEGDDLINRLTERTVHGEGRTLAVAPEDAANYIFNRSDLGFVGKRNLTRDLTRMRDVLGADSPEWGGIRSEVFGRIAHAGEGAPEGGVPQFSGQKFMKAWERLKTEDPQIVRTLFTPEERSLIDQFAEVAQVATTAIRGGDNPSNTAVAAKVLIRKFLDGLGTGTGAATGMAVAGPPGAAIGGGIGRAFDVLISDLRSASNARKALREVQASTVGRPQAPQRPRNRLIEGPLANSAVLGSSKLMGQSGAPGP